MCNASSDQSNSALANGIIDSKTKTILTTSGNAAFMSPLGPIQLTAEECNDILMKRAAAAVAANNQHAITTNTNDHHAGMLLTEECVVKNDVDPCFSKNHSAIAVQVQKVIQGLEEADEDTTATTHQLKIEPTLSISPKLEAVEIDYVR